MRNLNANPELEAYLRLNRAGCGEWLAAIRELLACPEVACQLARPQAVAGSMSALEVEAGAVCVLDVAQDMSFDRWLLPRTLLVAVVKGQVRLQDGCRLTAFPLAILPAGTRFSLQAGEGSRLVLVYPIAASVPAWHPPGLEAALAGHIQRFLMKSDYFQDHQDARLETAALFDRLNQQLASGLARVPEELPVLDRRLVRVIEKMRGEPDWVFNLPELAQHSGASERNLYYLMKRETGLTPYRFYQRCRLIRVRRRLVDCQCDVPHISWYAADAGFSHLGRFAALYREHFGELPSETVQWRRRLQDQPPALTALSSLPSSPASSLISEPW